MSKSAGWRERGVAYIPLSPLQNVTTSQALRHRGFCDSQNVTSRPEQRSEEYRNAFKHGRYSAEAIAGRREVAALIRAMRTLACATEEAS
jgi:hypothetical protein